MSIMDWLQNPQNQAALLGMTQGFAQSAQPTRMPLGFGAALGMGGAGALQGKLQGYPDYQLKQAEITGRQQQNQMGGMDLQQRQAQTAAANNAPVPMGFDPATWALIKSNPQAAIDIYKQQFNNKNQLANEQALKLSPSAPSAGMSPEAFGQQQQLKDAELRNEVRLKQTPGAALSPEAFGQQEQLVKDRIAATMGDPAAIESNAQAIAKYQQAPLSGFAISRPGGAATMARVMDINPDFKSQNYNQSLKAQQAFASGPQGNQTRFLNVAISHLSTLDRLAQALKNGDVQALNQVSNTFKEQFGSTAPTNFDAAKAIVGDEVVKAIIGSGGALADRENAQNQINRAKTPGQLADITKTYRELMSGQLRGLKQQYKTSTFLDDFEQKLSPETQAALQGAPPAASQGGKIPFANASGGLPAGVTEEDIQHTLMLHPGTTRAQLLQKLGGQ